MGKTMTIECYDTRCIHHPLDEPFCGKTTCEATYVKLDESEEVSQDDLEAAADMYDAITKNISPTILAIQLAKENHGIELLPTGSLDRVLGRFACSNQPMAECVAEEVKRMNTNKPVRKPFCVEVKASFFYEIPAEMLPEWADELGVEKLVESAFADKPTNNLPEAFGKDGILKMNPVEIAIDRIMAA